VAFRTLRYLYPIPMPVVPGRWLQDNPLRRRLLPPEWVVSALGVRPGMAALEIGPGTGLYTAAVARAIGPSGVLYVQDVQGPMLSALHARLKAEGSANVVVILGDAVEMELADD